MPFEAFANNGSPPARPEGIHSSHRAYSSYWPYHLIQALHHQHPAMDLSETCLALEVSRSGYNAHLRKHTRPRRQDATLAAEITSAFTASHAAYGSPRLVHALRANGCQYTSAEFNHYLQLRVITPSMSRTANCYDNAAMESFWATLKTECFQGAIPATRAQARAMLFDYIETFYNTTRLHSALGYLSPVAFESSFQNN